MTKEQFDYLRRVLAPASTPIPKEPRKTNCWRSHRTRLRTEVSLGTLLRRNDYAGPSDWR